MCGWQIKLCDPLVTHRPYLSALRSLYIKRYINAVAFTLLIITWHSSSCKLCSAQRLEDERLRARFTNDGQIAGLLNSSYF